MDWKGILEKIIIAVAAGTILALGGLVYSKMSSPSAQPITASLTSLATANPLFALPDKTNVDVSKWIKDNYGLDVAGYLLGAVSKGSEIRIGRIDFTNSGELKSKEISVTVQGALVFSQDAAENKIESKVTLKPLLPSKSTTVYFVEKKYLFTRPDITAIHDDRSIAIESRDFSEDFDWLLPQIAKYPFVFMILSMIGAVMLVSAILSLLFFVFVRDKQAWRAKYMTAEQVGKEIDFMDYVRINFPEKMPKEVVKTEPVAN